MNIRKRTPVESIYFQLRIASALLAELAIVRGLLQQQADKWTGHPPTPVDDPWREMTMLARALLLARLGRADVALAALASRSVPPLGSDQ